MFASLLLIMFERKSMEALGRKSPEEAKAAAKTPIVLILDDVRSMHNVGAAFRTADSFGIEAVYLCGYTPTPPHRDIRKTALGAEDTVTWQHFAKVNDAVQHIKDKGYLVVAVEQAHNSSSLETYQWDQQPLALIFGNEVNGVSDEGLAAAQGCIEIPQAGSKHSLNISVSVGVVIWELVRNQIRG
jgi:23S rRNA (guanosine2251-2'-O)-methyltransferase